MDTDLPPQPPPALHRHVVVQNYEPATVVRAAPDVTEVTSGHVEVDLPDRIPAQCVVDSAATYRINPMILLAILKVESNGRPGAIGKNTNGTLDIGPAQFNTKSWLPKFVNNYGISQESLLNNMCQAVRAMAFAVRTEINGVGGDVWGGIGNYHSRSPVHHNQYIGLVQAAHLKMVQTGKFDGRR